MKFAIITDIHHGPDGSGVRHGQQRKLVAKAVEEVKKTISTLNARNDIEFVVNLGDSIEDVNDESVDIAYFTEIQSELKTLTKPLYTLIGNHDQRTLSHNKLRELLGVDSLYHSFESSGIKFIALHVQMLGNHTVVQSDIRAGIDDEQLRWLKNELNSKIPVVVLSHYSAADMNLTNNFWFDGAPQHALISNRAELREIFEKSGNVIAFINGHVHWNNVTIHNSIPYITQQSISENFVVNGTPAGTHSVVEITDKHFDMIMYGNDALNIKFDLN